MNSSGFDPRDLLTVVCAELDAGGVLLGANSGFLRLLRQRGISPIGTHISDCFVQPTFADLITASRMTAAPSERQFMTMGDPAGKTHTLLGRVQRTEAGIRVLAEFDIVELERLSDAMLESNQESTVARYALMQANVALRQREVKILEVSMTDALTGVGNRRKLEQELNKEVSNVRIAGGALSAVMIDIDYFKQINDQYGHAAGDQVLAHVAALLQSQIRSSDVIARFGGEEFVVLLPRANLTQALAKAENLRNALALDVIEPVTRPVTASFGVAALQLGEQGESLLQRADQALHEAKAGGRNQVVAAASAGSAD